MSCGELSPGCSRGLAPTRRTMTEFIPFWSIPATISLTRIACFFRWTDHFMLTFTTYLLTLLFIISLHQHGPTPSQIFTTIFAAVFLFSLIRASQPLPCFWLHPGTPDKLNCSKEAPKGATSSRGTARLSVEWFLSRENNRWLGWKRFT